MCATELLIVAIKQMKSVVNKNFESHDLILVSVFFLFHFLFSIDMFKRIFCQNNEMRNNKIEKL
jgi:hypothetical protein